MHRSHARGIALTALVLALGVGSEREARAQTPSEIATAKQWFADGLAREEKGEWAAALELFRRAAQVKRTPQIVFHVGRCESRTGGLVEALVDLDNAATLARGAHADDVVTAAQAELDGVRGRIPTLDVRVGADGAPSRFIVDGSTIALSMLHTPMPLDPGEHTVTIEFSSGASATKSATLAEHDAKTIELAPPAPAAAVPAAAPPSVSPESSPASPAPSSDATPSSRSALPVILVGAGAALFIAGTVFFIDARSKESSLHDACPTRTGCDPSLQGSYDTATTFNSVGLVLGAVGIASAATGISLFAMRPSAGTSAALVVSPARVAWTMRF